MVEETKKQGTTKTEIGPIRWMSPESLSSREYSTASDVFSLAVVFYELAAETLPYSDHDILAVGAAVRDGQLRLTMPHDTPEWLNNLCNAWWSQSPSDRPTISQVCDIFLNSVL
jgi:serine/threonine protein kinase